MPQETDLVKGTFGDRTLAYSGAKVQSHFYPRDLVTCKRNWKIRSVSGRVPDYPGGGGRGEGGAVGMYDNG